MNTKTRLLFAIAAVTSIPVFAACGGGLDVGAGKYTALRIAATGSPALSGTCSADPNHTTTLRAGATVYIYGVSSANGDQLFLDLGGTVLVGGEQKDGSFRFAGNTTDIQTQGGTTVTRTTDVAVSFTADGATVAGNTSVHEKIACSGNQCQGFQNATDCTTTTAFNGVQVEDADAPPPSTGNNPVP